MELLFELGGRVMVPQKVEAQVPCNPQQECRHIGHCAFLLGALPEAQEGLLEHVLCILPIAQDAGAVAVNPLALAGVEFVECSFGTLAVWRAHLSKEFLIATVGKRALHAARNNPHRGAWLRKIGLSRHVEPSL